MSARDDAPYRTSARTASSSVLVYRSVHPLVTAALWGAFMALCYPWRDLSTVGIGAGVALLFGYAFGRPVRIAVDRAARTVRLSRPGFLYARKEDEAPLEAVQGAEVQVIYGRGLTFGGNRGMFQYDADTYRVAIWMGATQVPLTLRYSTGKWRKERLAARINDLLAEAKRQA